MKNGTRGEEGWGEEIARFFDTQRLRVENRARGGRSSRTFQTEGLWDQVLTDARSGDFLLVQMGHNDGGPLDDPARARGTIRGTGDESREIDNPITHKKEVVHTYGWYLRKYITDAKAKGMRPIILSPVPRVPRGKVEQGAEDKNPYVTWAGEAARSQNVPFIDLNHLIMEHYAGLTPEEIKAKYFTEADNTHTSRAGAELNASCVVEGLRATKDSPLAACLLDKPRPAR